MEHNTSIEAIKKSLEKKDLSQAVKAHLQQRLKILEQNKTVLK